MQGKVMYTIAEESLYMKVNNVPGLGLVEELKALCGQYGKVLE